MHDGIACETLGLPTAVVITTAFVSEARLQGRALGMSELEPVVITHPLSSLTDDEIDGRAQQVIEQAPRVWLGGQARNNSGGDVRPFPQP
jgi:hypothetical protein